jgi:hypothetical protein
MVTLRSLNVLPSNLEMLKASQALAVLDLILMPEWQYRYYSFNKTWSSSEMLASMRNGSGDHYFAGG